MGEISEQWLSRGETTTTVDDAGAVLRAWRATNRQSQAAVAELLNTTQQHLSQIEKGTRPLSLEQRRTIVAELGIPAEELGLSSGQARHLGLSDDASPEVTSAVKHLDPPQLFESRPSYRLLGGSLTDRRLDFGLAAYFDKLDISEAVGHELAAACMADPALMSSPRRLRGRLPFRDRIGDPFDPQRRAIIPAITTLTIRLRRYPAEPSFLLHWRDPAKVATAGGIYDVIPAGEFQPSSVALWDRHNDFSIWRNIVREYSEELLGTPEHDGTRSQPINYPSWPLYGLLEQGFETGAVSAHLLGIGLDALTLAATILTVVVIDDDVFERAFGSVVRYNDEGEIVALPTMPPLRASLSPRRRSTGC